MTELALPGRCALQTAGREGASGPSVRDA